MYSTDDWSDRDDTRMVPAILSEPCNFVQVVVGAARYRNGGEPFHISKVAGRRSIRSRKHLLDNPIRDLKYYSHLHYTMTCVIMRLER